jgi:hypothetical protein
MSQHTPHTYKGFSVHFDEIEPADTITMRQATWEKLKETDPQAEREQAVLAAMEPEHDAEPAEEHHEG